VWRAESGARDLAGDVLGHRAPGHQGSHHLRGGRLWSGPRPARAERAYAPGVHRCDARDPWIEGVGSVTSGLTAAHDPFDPALRIEKLARHFEHFFRRDGADVL